MQKTRRSNLALAGRRLNRIFMDFYNKFSRLTFYVIILCYYLMILYYVIILCYYIIIYVIISCFALQSKLKPCRNRVRGYELFYFTINEVSK